MDNGKALRYPDNKNSINPHEGAAGEIKAHNANPRLYTLRVDLMGAPIARKLLRGEISRIIQIRGDQSLDALHMAIFDAFDRTEERLYEFNTGKDAFDRSGWRYTPHDRYDISGREELGAADSASVRIDSLALSEGQIFHYIFDFGDYWEHQITVVAIDRAPVEGEFPRVVEKIGESPAQYPDRDADEAEGPVVAEAMMEYMQALWRDRVEEKSLPRNSRLHPALNKLPSQWLEAICKQVKLPAFHRAKERAKALAEHLPLEESLEAIWSQLPEPSRRMLKWIVVNEEGRTSIGELAERFEPEADRSWYWNEGDVPTTPLGLLRLHGVVFVGMTKIGDQREKSAVVPIELREGLRLLAEAPGSFENAPPMPPPKEGVLSSVGREDIEQYLREILMGEPQAEPAKEPEEVAELDDFLMRYPLSRLTEWMYCDVVEKISAAPFDHDMSAVHELLSRMVSGGRAKTRLMAYRLGLTAIGRRFAEPALNDDSEMVSSWAKEVLE